jgi:hypothetical protein
VKSGDGEVGGAIVVSHLTGGAPEKGRAGQENVLKRLMREEKLVPLLNTTSHLTSTYLLTDVLFEVLKE